MTTYNEIMSVLAEMKSRFDSGFSAHDKTIIEKLYRRVLDKEIVNLSCGNCYRDAYVEIYAHLKKTGTLPTYNYKLKSGHYLHKFGNSEYYFNPIKDEIAEHFLSENPNLIDEFAEFPNDWRKRTRIDAESHEPAQPVQMDAEPANVENDAIFAEKPKRKYTKRKK